MLAPGDPGRALRLAQWLLEAPRMLNHHRGLWGYTGVATADGAELTIQSTGTGGPSAALVIADLAALGARRIVRVGTATTAGGGAGVGALLVGATVRGRDGTSRALGGGAPDPRLTEALSAAGALAVALESVDVPGGEPGADAQDLSSAAVLAAAARARLRAACAVAVTRAGEDGITPEALAAAEEALGRLALAALAADG